MEKEIQQSPITLETLKAAVSGSAAAFRCRRRLQPAGGPGDKVFPPTFAGAIYAVEQRRLPGRAEPVTCVILDTVQSQANRMELALQEAIDAKMLSLPLVIVDFTPWSPTGDVDADKKAGRLIDAVGKITSLQLPHRLADAILRDSEIEEEVNGEKKFLPFRKSSKGMALNNVSLQNATPLYQLCPTALIFGMWDSTGPKGGLGAKFERAMVSEVVGVGASISDIHKARGVRRDPLEIRNTIPISKEADGCWSIVEPKTKGAVKPSEINHCSVPFDSSNAGTTIEYAEQVTTLSLIVLRRLRFPISKSEDENNEDFNARAHKAEIAARTVLASLGLCAAALAFENGMGLRSRCLLWPEGPMQWALLDKPGEHERTFTLTGTQAVELFKNAVKEAKEVGLDWETTPIVLSPQKKLLELVRRSQLEATKGT